MEARCNSCGETRRGKAEKLECEDSEQTSPTVASAAKMVKGYQDVFRELGYLPGIFHLEIQIVILPRWHLPYCVTTAPRVKEKKQPTKVNGKMWYQSYGRSIPGQLFELRACLNMGKCFIHISLIKVQQSTLYQVPAVKDVT